MNGEALKPVTAGMPELQYPLHDEPGTGDGSSIEVAPGVHWLRMPLRQPLGWINVWALLTPDTASIVDTGIRSLESVAAWESALRGVFRGRKIRSVLATHMHPDHCGLAGWFAEQHRVELWMSRLEYLTCRVLAADTGNTPPPAGIEFYRSAGWTNDALDRYRAEFGSFGHAIYPLPASYHRLSDGDEVNLGGHAWRVVIASGHSPEHACLYCPELKLLISGDQVLPRITSNVSVYPTEPDADPLREWLTSLRRLSQCVPDDVLVLPAHNSPFTGLHARIQQLIAHHERALERLHEQLIEPKRAVDVFSSLFKRAISPDVLSMATGEAIAHLNFLQGQNLVTRDTNSDGVWYWRRA